MYYDFAPIPAQNVDFMEPLSWKNRLTDSCAHKSMGVSALLRSAHHPRPF